eukprot:SAG31_NODE_230_length_19771_cov_90.041739_13_plen_331_part_00
MRPTLGTATTAGSGPLRKVQSGVPPSIVIWDWMTTVWAPRCRTTGRTDGRGHRPRCRRSWTERGAFRVSDSELGHLLLPLPFQYFYFLCHFNTSGVPDSNSGSLRHARLEAAAKEAAAAKAAAIGRSKAAGAAVVAAGTLSHAALVAKGSPGDDGELRSPMRSPMRSPRPPEGGGPKVSPRRLRAPKGFCSSVEQLAVAVEATKARLHELRASGALDPQPASPSHSDSIADGLRGKLDQLESKQWKRIEKKVRNVEKSWGVKDSQEEQAKLLEAERLSEERLRKLEDDNAVNAKAYSLDLDQKRSAHCSIRLLARWLSSGNESAHCSLTP